LLAELDKKILSVADIFTLQVLYLVLTLFVFKLPLLDDLPTHVYLFLERAELLLHIK